MIMIMTSRMSRIMMITDQWSSLFSWLRCLNMLLNRMEGLFTLVIMILIDDD